MKYTLAMQYQGQLTVTYMSLYALGVKCPRLTVKEYLEMVKGN